MSGLGAALAAATASGGVDIVTGTVDVTADGGLTVTHQGVPVPVTWLDPVHVDPGDSVLLAVTRAAVGQSSAVVLGRVTDTPRATSGKVEAVAGVVATVTTTYGRVEAVFTGSAPSVGAQVRLIWQGRTATVLGTVGTVTPTGDAVTTVGAPAQATASRTSGTTVLRATSSGSWTTRGTRWTGAVVQGTGYGMVGSTGGWGYGAAIRSLAGVTVTGATLRLPGRNRSGAYNAGLVLKVGCHRQTDLTGRPEIAAPGWDLTIPPAGSGWPIETPVPQGVAQWLVTNAGGLMVSEGAYGGVLGTDSDPTSGQITITWTR